MIGHGIVRVSLIFAGSFKLISSPFHHHQSSILLQSTSLRSGPMIRKQEHSTIDVPADGDILLRPGATQRNQCAEWLLLPTLSRCEASLAAWLFKLDMNAVYLLLAVIFYWLVLFSTRAKMYAEVAELWSAHIYLYAASLCNRSTMEPI